MCILPPWESKLLRFCWGAISLAHANADDLIIPIKARPSGICYQAFHVITMSDYSLKNDVKHPLLWEFWIYSVYRRILGRVLVGNIVYISNEWVFFWVCGEWIRAQNKSSENLFAVHKICLSRAPIHYRWTQKKKTLIPLEQSMSDHVHTMRVPACLNFLWHTLQL